MSFIRIFFALLSVAAALFCASQAYMIHFVNSRSGWFAGPVTFFGVTMSSGVATAASGLLALLLLCLAAYVFFGSTADN